MRSRSPNDLIGGPAQYPLPSSVFLSERRKILILEQAMNEQDAEDILQDVFFELVEAYRLLKPIEEAGAWLFRVARNRIIDRFRKKRPEPLTEARRSLEDLLPSQDAGPEAAYARGVLLDELDAALDELLEEQRLAFVANELEGRSFRELAAETGVPLNTLLARKHTAVRHLRRRLQSIYDDFKER